MSTEIINAKSDPSPGGPPPYHSVQSRRYSKSAETIAKQNAFLKAYSRHGTVTHASRDAGVHVSYHYNWLEIDPDYPAKFKLAHQEAVEALEREARRRAIEGVEEPTGWYKGEPGGFVKRYSDTLLIFLLKGALPDKYKDRHEHTGKNGGPIEVQSTVTIEQFPIWLKQAIVVISSGIEIDPEVERVLMSHFEAKFLEAEKRVGEGVTEGQKRVIEAESYQGEAIEIGPVVEAVTQPSEDQGLYPVSSLVADQELLGSNPDGQGRGRIESSDRPRPYRPIAKRDKVTLDMDDI